MGEGGCVLGGVGGEEVEGNNEGRERKEWEKKLNVMHMYSSVCFQVIPRLNIFFQFLLISDRTHSVFARVVLV